MSTRRALLGLVRADFLERSRRPAFLVIVALVIYLGYVVDTGQMTVRLEHYRGVMNSAWAGSMMAMVTTSVLGLVGFFLINDSIKFDARSGVGQFIATSPISRGAYTVAKWLSNFLVLAVLVCILMCASLVVQWTHGEDPHLDIWALVAPMAFVALPMMALVAAFAVLFQVVPVLRTGFGSVVWFVFFCTGLVLMGSLVPPETAWLDPFGLRLFSSSMVSAAKAAFPEYGGGFALTVVQSAQLQRFDWPGIDWSPSLVSLRLMWVGVAAAIAWLASGLLDRASLSSRAGKAEYRGNAANPSVPAEETVSLRPPSSLSSQPVSQPIPGATRSRFALLRACSAELRLLLKGERWWWYAIAAALIAGGALASSAAGRRAFLLLAWIWPLMVWSTLGTREARFETGAWLHSSPRPIARQLVATWLAGVAITALTGSGVAARVLIEGDRVGQQFWLAGILFIPSLALALGVWGRTRKLFEVLYLVLWYVGPLNGLSTLDFTGTTQGSAPQLWIGIAAVCAVLALLGRRWQLKH